MSDKKSRAIGSLANWDVITTGTPEENTIPISDHEYTIVDLYALLRQLKNLFNPDYLDYVASLITKHVHDMDNPHRTDLSKMNTSVLQELYLLWLEQPNEGTREEFLKILFQYVKIADILTTLEGVALDQVPSVRGVTEVIHRHNTNLDAHANIFSSMFPGEELYMTPTLALMGMVGISQSVEVVRPGTLSYIDEHGRVKFAAENTLPIDYTYGEGMFPIFGNIFNRIKYSEDFNQAYWTKENGTVDISTFTINPYGLGFSPVFKENVTENPVEHILKTSEAISVTANRVYALTWFVAPEVRKYVGLRVPTDLVGDYPYVHFDLENLTYFMNDQTDKTRVAADISTLRSGMIRICMFIRPSVNGTFFPELYPIDILSGDANYVGTGESSIAIFGAQFSECSEIPPYIPTFGTVVTINNTKVQIPIDNWYNPTTGTFVVECSNVTPLQMNVNKEIFSIADGTNAISFNCRFPGNHQKRAYFTAFNSSNIAILNRWSVACDRPMITLVHGYSPSKHRFGFFESNSIETNTNSAVNPNSRYLYLGTDRFGNNHFNGRIKRFVYYPNICTLDNINFFLGE